MPALDGGVDESQPQPSPAAAAVDPESSVKTGAAWIEKKKTGGGDRYYYLRWRVYRADGTVTKPSQYLSPVED